MNIYIDATTRPLAPETIFVNYLHPKSCTFKTGQNRAML